MSYTDLSAVQVVEMLCNRDITAVQYASASLAKAKEWSCINAWSEIDPARVSSSVQQTAMSYCSLVRLPAVLTQHGNCAGAQGGACG